MDTKRSMARKVGIDWQQLTIYCTVKSCLADWQGIKTTFSWPLADYPGSDASDAPPAIQTNIKIHAIWLITQSHGLLACSKFVITARPDLSIQRQSRVRDTIIDNLDLDSNWNVSFVCLQLLIQAFIYFCIDMECFVVQYLTWNFMIINKYLRRISVYFWLEMSILSLYIFRHTPTQTATIAKQYAT